MDILKGKWALVTGASSGIGADLSRLLAQAGCNLVVTARRTERLETLKRELELEQGVQVEIISSDLSLLEGAKELYEAVEAKQLQISVLVNNAGIGLNGKFIDLDLQRQMAMIQLNINSLTELSHRFLPGMNARGECWILQVASTYSFQPGVGYATYAASKAYVLSLSEALNHELRGSNIKHCALCPGPTRTEFFEVAGNTGNPFMNALMMDSERVAEIGLNALLKGKAVVVPGSINRTLVFVQRLLPRSFVVTLSAMFGK